MVTSPFILNDYKAFTMQTTIATAKSFFKETTFRHFPVIEETHLVGLISEVDVEGIEDMTKTLSDFQYLFQSFFAKEDFNLLDVIKVFSENITNIIPVVNDKNLYKGYYDLMDVLHILNETPFINSEGISLELEKEMRDFSFSEVSQIVESNNGKILGVFVTELTSNVVKITLKIATQEVNEILQTFRRYNYSVLSSIKEDDLIEELKDRSNYLQKYLNI